MPTVDMQTHGMTPDITTGGMIPVLNLRKGLNFNTASVGVHSGHDTVNRDIASRTAASW